MGGGFLFECTVTSQHQGSPYQQILCSPDDARKRQRRRRSRRRGSVAGEGGSYHEVGEPISCERAASRAQAPAVVAVSCEHGSCQSSFVEAQPLPGGGCPGGLGWSEQRAESPTYRMDSTGGGGISADVQRWDFRVSSTFFWLVLGRLVNWGRCRASTTQSCPNQIRSMCTSTNGASNDWSVLSCDDSAPAS